jgi:SAM-dependent methyltransferase
MASFLIAAQSDNQSPSATTRPVRRVLNAGSGPWDARPLHPAFTQAGWKEIRFDVDPGANPDFVGSIIDMKAVFPAESFDAIWSSHILEHLFAHEILSALSEFRRVLKRDGFALITSPDLEAIARLVLDHGPDHVAYTAPAGPITGLDMLYGHSASVARGQVHMAHKSGFTCASLGQRLIEAGFPTVLGKSENFDLWAVAMMERADKAVIQYQLSAAGLDMFDDDA